MKQEDALDLLKMGKNIFLTGAAGAGKTYVLNQYIRYLKENHVAVAVTASTGIAATHLNGSTIHAWSGIGVHDALSPTLLDHLQTKDHIKRNYKKTKVLIIDEISMLHKNQLDMIDAIAKRLLSSEKPFGGMQVVLCGDFFQLPPITASKTNDVIFAYEASAWNVSDFHVCYLHEQHRQAQDPLMTILNDIRTGNAGEHTKIPLRTRYKKEPESDIKPTKLYARNVNVDLINEEALNALSEKEKIFKMRTHGFEKLVDGLKRNCLALDTLRLKIGAEVMFIKNDINGRYVNGTRCVIIGFDQREGWPVVKTQHATIIARPEEWTIEENGIIRATVTQVPLRLAWAITIHKSQGMTLDAAEMDLGDTFEPGMGYVALSRVRSLSGLKLMNLNAMALTVHPAVLKKDLSFQSDSRIAEEALSTLSTAEKINQQERVLTHRFAGQKTPPKKKKTTAKKSKIATHLVTKSLLEKALSLETIAKERELTIGTVVSHIEKLYGLQLLDNKLITHLKSTISAEDFDLIATTFQKAKDNSLSTTYEKLNAKFSYTLLRLVRLLLQG